MTTSYVSKALLTVLAFLVGTATACEARSAAPRSERGTRSSVLASTIRPQQDCVRAPRVGAFATAPWTVPPCEPTDRAYRSELDAGHGAYR
ncbi:hypothetical protein ACVIHH_003048 [Bradyrhizobium sp. USDA 4518]